MITLAAFLSSSMAEHSAVNRRVVSSSLTWGAKSFEKCPKTGHFSCICRNTVVTEFSDVIFPILFPHIIPLTKKAHNIWLFCDICIFSPSKFYVNIVNRTSDRDPRLPRNTKNCRNERFHALRQFAAYFYRSTSNNPRRKNSGDCMMPYSSIKASTM